MVVQKLDVQIADLTDHQESVGQLRLGEQVALSPQEGSAQLRVCNQAGQELGILDGSNNRDLCAQGQRCRQEHSQARGGSGASAPAHHPVGPRASCPQR